MQFFDSNKTAKLKVENSGQTTSMLYPVTFNDSHTDLQDK
jgi:hypothetical protein